MFLLWHIGAKSPFSFCGDFNNSVFLKLCNMPNIVIIPKELLTRHSIYVKMNKRVANYSKKVTVLRLRHIVYPHNIRYCKQASPGVRIIMKKRENGLDLLRLIAAFLVVFGHEISTYKNLYEKAAETAGGMAADFSVWVIGFARAQIWAVDAFFMLSGAFVLSSAKTTDFGGFYKNMRAKLVRPTVIFSIFFFVVMTLMNIMFGMPFGTALYYEVQKTLTGRPADHMWYMFVLIGMYLCAPFIKAGKDLLGQKGFEKAAVFAFVWGILSLVAQPQEYDWSTGKIAGLLGMFMLGNVIHDRLGDKKDNKLGAAVLCLGILSTVIVMILYVHKNIMYDCPAVLGFRLTDVAHPLTALGGAAFFTAFHLLDVKKDMFKSAELTFYIYLVHPFMQIVVELFSRGIFKTPDSVYGTPMCAAAIIISSIVCYALSMLASMIIVNGKNKKKAAGKPA